MIKQLGECKKCKLHNGMEGTFVMCGRTKQFTVMVRSEVSHDIPGIDNGTIVIECDFV